MGNALSAMKEYGGAMAKGCVMGTTAALVYGGVKAALAGPEALGVIATAGCVAAASGAAIGLHQSRKAAEQHVAAAPKVSSAMAM